jgi:MFS family permease
MTFPTSMLSSERRAVFFLTLIYAVRMIGLFLVLPVFVLHAAHLQASTPQLVGFAIGVYGLTQALLQIPYGICSDRYGRKPVILVGLLIFAAGSLLAARADDIYSLLAGRALQGAGAIAGVVMALAADLTRDSQRSKAMAAIGLSIGAAFLVSIVAGPLLYVQIGGPGLFDLTAILAVLAMGFLVWGVPPVTSLPKAPPGPVAAVTPANSELLRINGGIFILHAVLTANFVVIPLVLRDSLGLAVDRHGWLYLVTMAAAVTVMLPGLIYAEKRRRTRALLLAAAGLIMISQIGLLSPVGRSLYGFGGLLFLFFVGFNTLEAALPALISRKAPAQHRGAALGAYSTSQFLGAFAGGVLAGWLLHNWGTGAVFMLGVLLPALWLPAVFGLKPLPQTN